MIGFLKSDEKSVSKTRKMLKLLFVFLIAFALVLYIVSNLLSVSPNVKLKLSASQLEHHDVFAVPAGELEIDLHNDTAKPCIFAMFSYANAGSIRTNFLSPIAPGKTANFTKEVKENQAYGIKCSQGSLDFEWKDLPVLIVSGPNDTLVWAEIKNGVVWDLKANARLSQIKVSPTGKLWLVIKNSDSNYWRFDIVLNKEIVAKEGMPLKIYEERYWPPLKQGQVIVLGPMSFKKGTYLAGIREHNCIEECHLQSKIMIVSR